MKTVRRLLYTEVLTAIAFVTLAFLALFYFIDFVEEIEDVGKNGYTLVGASLYTLLEVPGHFYELLPISVLIGAIYALSRLAQSSEFTILRTGGLSPGRALWLLAVLGIGFAALTFVTGDYLAPLSDRAGARLQASYRGDTRLKGAGAWLKDRQGPGLGDHNFSVNVQGVAGDGTLQSVRIFEFDADGRMVSRLSAATATVGRDGEWTLRQVERTDWAGADESDAASVKESQLPQFEWRSSLSQNVVAAALRPAATMSTVELYRYTSHLSENEQAAQRHEIAFWKKAFYPFACIVMVALALPFAYMHARSGGLSLRVFGGIMLGISFVLLNNVAGHVGLLQNWTPWLISAAPPAFYLLLSLGAFSWLVRYR